MTPLKVSSSEEGEGRSDHWRRVSMPRCVRALPLDCHRHRDLARRHEQRTRRPSTKRSAAATAARFVWGARPDRTDWVCNRTTRHVAPTPAGERLLVRLLPVMEELESALEELNEYRDRPTGCLRLAIAPAASHMLGPVLARFAGHCIRLRTVSGGIDLWQFVRGNEEFSVPVDGAITLNDVALALHTALSGGGLLYLPESCAKPALAAGALQGILQAWMPGPSDGFVLYYPSRRQNPAALRCLADFLRENLRREQFDIVPSPDRLLCA